MTERKMKKIMKREARRKRARGIGAFAGTATAFAILGVLYGGDMKKEAKLAAGEIKAKLGLAEKENA
ncbi:MAG: hypothetical protein IKE74_08180 [Mogibacterium sp.]|nr:hypothetical protein [Mogibacterium sp.]